MLPFEKILCPVDFTDASGAALSAAAELASHFGAQLHLLHVLEPFLADTVLPAGLGVYGYIPPDMNDFQRKESLEKLASLSETAVPADVKVLHLVRQGEAAHQILEYAREEAVDLIVMATHARGGWSHLLFGSVTETEVRDAPCPVLTVHTMVEAHETRTEQLASSPANSL